jgi:hypothetical protein
MNKIKLIIIKKIYILNNLIEWGLGIGDWGLGVGAHTPNPKPQTQNPKPKLKKNN